MSSFAAKQYFVVWIFLSISILYFSLLVPRFLVSLLFSPLTYMSGLYCFGLEQTINVRNTICPCTWTIISTKGFSNEGQETVSNAHHIYSTELNND